MFDSIAHCLVQKVFYVPSGLKRMLEKKSQSVDFKVKKMPDIVFFSPKQTKTTTTTMSPFLDLDAHLPSVNGQTKTSLSLF